jgi:hypothetical protein
MPNQPEETRPMKASVINSHLARSL